MIIADINNMWNRKLKKYKWNKKLVHWKNKKMKNHFPDWLITKERLKLLKSKNKHGTLLLIL